MLIIDRQELERHACECYEHLKLYMADLFAAAQDVSVIAPSSSMPEDRRVKRNTFK
jgi:hypothetical protein